MEWVPSRVWQIQQLTATQESYLFRISELRESGTILPAQDANGQWKPTDELGANIIVTAGATGVLWLCDGWQIKRLVDNSLPRSAKMYKTYSMYYCHGKGFQVLRDNAISPRREEIWLPLSFDHDRTDYSSYLTNARFEPALHCYRTDQKWMKMLLPDVYHGSWPVPVPYGGLKGELAIFLALIAFAIPVDRLQQDLPAMFHSGKWQQYEMGNGSMCAHSLCKVATVSLTIHYRVPQARCRRRSLDMP